MAYTTGPWDWDEYGDIVDLDGTTIASVQDHGNVNTIAKTGESFSHADARLISAAPELLASCIRLVNAMKDYEMEVDHPAPKEHTRMMADAYNAIAKATLDKRS